MSASQYHSESGTPGKEIPAVAGKGSSRYVSESDRYLAWFAKLVVAATFGLIFVGGLVTSHQAGMAVPDWPLSFGSLNPTGWWGQLPVRLEHGHRLFAMCVGLLTGVLCAWVWENWYALLYAAIVSAVIPPVAAKMGASKLALMHLGIWPAAVVFVIAVLLSARARAMRRSPTVRALGLAAFACVCVQATLGGFRVTQETAGSIDTALILRIVHGIFAQTFLCVNVTLAAMLSSAWLERYSFSSKDAAIRRVRTLSWVGFGAVYLQLIFGAAMRHMGAGLAIPTFPQAGPNGSFLPAVHNAYIDTNFTHTRVGALVVTVLLVLAALSALRSYAVVPRLGRPAIAIISLVIVQVALGICVIWYLKPQTLTTFHVVNGAVLLATTLLLALRSSRAVRESETLSVS